MLSLRPRLKVAADMVTPGKVVADIGTDHAYLPAYLLLNGTVPSAIACDIGVLPLENAAATVKRYTLGDKVSLRVANGLDGVACGEADEVTICGMGGTLIAEILAKAEHLVDADMRFILQPMTHAEDVREYLCKNGFFIEKEVCVRDDGRVYCCMSAHRTCDALPCSPGFYYFGKLSGVTDEERFYIKKTADRVRIRLNAIRNVDRFPEEQKKLAEVLEYYERVYCRDGE